MNAQHIVTVTFHAQADQLAAFEQIMRSVKLQLPTIQGCLGVRVLRSAEQPQIFVLVEDWESNAQHAAHISNLIEGGDWAEIEAMLQAPPTSMVLQDI